MKDLEGFFSEELTSSGDLIRAFRKKFKISQKELCEITGINENNLSAIENGRRELGIQSAKKIASFFGFDPSFLLFPKGYKEVFNEFKQIRSKAEKLFGKKKIA